MSGKVGDNLFRASGLVKAVAAGRTGTVDWCTTAKTSPFTATTAEGYFVNTTCGSVTVTLPSSPSAGDIVSLKDYADTWDSNSVTLGRGGSKISGNCNDGCLGTEGQTVTMVYVDGTRGWLNTQTDTTVGGSDFISATGGTITCCGDYKMHKFTATGCFALTQGACAANNNVSYLVVAGGGGGGSNHGGGAGGGGFREGSPPADPYTASPLAAACSSLPVSTQTYTITVGGGGPAGDPPGNAPTGKGTPGTDSVFSTITSTGGGKGSVEGTAPAGCAGVGGSGGGGAYTNATGRAGKAGNCPPTSPAQGTPGGNSITYPPGSGGGGGGATIAGSTGTPGTAGPGGDGATTSIIASPTIYAGGGGAGRNIYGSSGGGAGGDGGGGAGSTGACIAATSGTPNTGGGGGGGFGSGPGSPGGDGGSGVVIIRYKFQ